MSLAVSVMFLAVATGLACSVPGSFLVLSRRSMLVDAISHAVLPGVVVGFWFTRDLTSPLLILAAAGAGLIVVAGSEFLGRTGLISGDAPQGLIFPALFSAGVLLITLRFAHVQLDAHSVLVGELNYVAIKQLELGGLEFGPRYGYVMLGVLALNVLMVVGCFRALEVTTFDHDFAKVRGLPVRSLMLGITFLTTVTVTSAFYAVGAVLVISLMVVPSAAAALFARSLTQMLWFSAGFALIGALGGFWGAYVIDAPTSAGMAVFYGTLFAVCLVVSRLLRRGPTRPRPHVAPVGRTARPG
ncbi:metal ABC transporter permease [Arachnia propionica]|uniref:Metal ABC transporter permease n=1 Tax=Arachnia propionica TaxID=1750 RepID=A0A3P1T6C1_9ACTN|nr:metal ABC transporter permease [Arachnia propionica]MDO5083394.1 metal ABC transporter permease [Arachnia propionica]RRD04735.1 metal ABC transporter permease [Arachnia propionica]